MGLRSWQCPFCNGHAILSDDDTAGAVLQLFSVTARGGGMGLSYQAIRCPNAQCGEIWLQVRFGHANRPGANKIIFEETEKWTLRPPPVGKHLPDYVPVAISNSYREACLIRDLSPKASATLSRRCLQGMIRDYWGVKAGNLQAEIEALEGKVAPQTWKAIDAVRKFGNIGAHMEKDIDLIIDVDPDEAQLLIGLIEQLIEDWYVLRHDRDARAEQLIAAAAAKKPQNATDTVP